MKHLTDKIDSLEFEKKELKEKLESVDTNALQKNQ
jgi:hypothetical protein